MKWNASNGSYNRLLFLLVNIWTRPFSLSLCAVETDYVFSSSSFVISRSSISSRNILCDSNGWLPFDVSAVMMRSEWCFVERCFADKRLLLVFFFDLLPSSVSRWVRALYTPYLRFLISELNSVFINFSVFQHWISPSVFWLIRIQ